MNEKLDRLVDLAIKSKEMAYVPYSKFRVGAAVLSADGRIFGGCNIENASYGATNCAERTAVFKSVSEGARQIEAIAIASDHPTFAYPCGICRQVMAEFGQDIIIILVNKNREIIQTNIEDLLPHSFTKKDLPEENNEF
ncbi:MAG: cytidine deaminase [Eubacteriaceae bacterium]|nr:cytidine deaminase [Eubacteriaceae bacterium]